jgi:hypothetical protein
MIKRELHKLRSRGLLRYLVDVAFSVVGLFFDLVFSVTDRLHRMRAARRQNFSGHAGIRCPECHGSYGMHVMGCSQRRTPISSSAPPRWSFFV